MGEGFGELDEALLAYVSSSNIACGGHAGDPRTMQRTVAWAEQHGVAIGAHPGLPDREGFGRRELPTTPREAHAMVLDQIGALHTFVKAIGAKLHHVKPHGALYNMAARNEELAMAIAQAVHDFDPQLILVGLFGSALILAGHKVGLRVAAEAFADRSYEADGSLTPRKEAGAILEMPRAAAEQALRIVTERKVCTRQGTLLSIDADTICLHGDRPDALLFAREVRQTLDRAGIAVRSLAKSER